ncbi:MAG: type I secretion system permease/ATPase [Alphaproteobacteria bacterium]
MSRHPSPRSTTALVLRQGGGLLAAAVLFSIAINVLALTAPLYMLQLYDRVLASRSLETLLYLSVIAAAALATFATLDGVRHRLLARVGARFEDAMGGLVFRRAMFMGAATGSLAPASAREIEQVRLFIGGTPITAFLDFPWIFIFLAVLYALHPWFFLVAVAAAAVLLVLALVSEIATRGAVGRQFAAEREARELATTARRNAEAVEAMGMGANVFARWYRAQDAALGAQVSARDRESRIGAVSKFVRLVTQSAMLGVGAYLVLMDQATPGVMIAASVLAARALAPIDVAVGSWKSFVAARRAAGKLGEFLRTTQDRRESLALPAPAGRVAVERVVLHLPAHFDPVLEQISFKVEPGQTLAIVGPSAAGKSSLLRVIAGIWRPTAGSARLDGAETFNWPRSQFARHVGFLPQDVDLFDGTVAENIARLGEPDGDAVVEAAQRAQAHELILSLPMGYETRIGANGVRLSAGQRQRIGFARALFGAPALVLLDEPNSHLDQDGDEALAAAIRRLNDEKRTVIVVAHRPSVLQVATHILVLKQGRIADFGKRTEVMMRLRRARPEPAAGGAVPVLRPVAVPEAKS